MESDDMIEAKLLERCPWRPKMHYTLINEVSLEPDFDKLINAIWRSGMASDLQWYDTRTNGGGPENPNRCTKLRKLCI